MAAKKVDLRDEAFAFAIGGHLTAKGITHTKFAESMGVKRVTLWNWISNPSGVTLGRLRVLAHKAQMSDEAILQIVRGARS